MWTELGIALIIFGFLLLIMEINIPGFFIGIPATVSMALGMMAIVFQEEVNTWPVFFISVAITFITFGATIKFYQKLAPPEKRLTHVTSGSSLVGKKGIAIDEVNHETIEGKVRIQSVIYSARAFDDTLIKEGKKVEVIESSGVHLIVREIGNDAPRKMSKPIN